MRATMPTRSLALCALLLWATGCAGSPRRVQSTRTEAPATARVVSQNPSLDARDRGEPYRWSDGTVVLQARSARSARGRGLRLSTELASPRGNRTPFILDTGSTATWLSWSSPLARDAFVDPRNPCSVDYGSAAQGHWGYVSNVSMGPLQGPDMPMALHGERHTLNSAANVLGFPQFFHTQLEHTNGQWLLRSGTGRGVSAPAGWEQVAFIPGLPLVRVEDPNGRPTVALIDTGAPENFALRGAPCGTYKLRSADGKATLEIPVPRTGPFPTTNLWGHEVTMLIGMDWLSTQNWRMTFDRGLWAFQP
jgi:hypothetical protein